MLLLHWLVLSLRKCRIRINNYSLLQKQNQSIQIQQFIVSLPFIFQHSFYRMPKSSTRQGAGKSKPTSEKFIPFLSSIEPVALTDSHSMNQLEQANVLKVLRKYLPMKKHIKKQNLPQDYKNQMRSSCSSLTNEQEAKCVQKRGIEQHTYPSRFIEPIPFVKLERIQCNQECNQNFMNMSYEMRKINECIEKLQILLTTEPQKDLIPFRTRIGYFVNSIILATAFLIEKKTFKETQIIQSQDHTETLNSELRSEIYKIQANNELLRDQVEQMKCREEANQKQLSKVRSILDSYQAENFQLRDQVKTLNMVIQEMNLQVQKAQKKLQSKRKEFNILKSDYQKMIIYCRQLQQQLREEFDCREEMERLSEEIKFQKLQIDKWKQRYFEQQITTGKQKQKFNCY